MASIEPGRVADAARKLKFGATRTGADYVRLLVLKYHGLKPGGTTVTVSNASVIDACDNLFKASNIRPYFWFDPFSGEWKRMAANGGWPVGSVKTQYERPNKTFRKLLEVVKHGADIEVSTHGTDNDYYQCLTELATRTKPDLPEALIWFSRNRSDLSDSTELEVGHLLPEFQKRFYLTDEELKILFDFDTNSLQKRIPLTTDQPQVPLAALLSDPGPIDPAELTLISDQVEESAQADDDTAGYAWTQRYARETFVNSDIGDIVDKVKEMAASAYLVLPEEDTLVERCVVALLAGHLVLQGPPGTAKTTLARLLAEAFSADTAVATATADWTTYEVIGGLRPKHDKSLEPVLGYVPKEALACAEAMKRAETNTVESDHSKAVPTARWLIIDELNRADIDRAVGSLYTVLSSAHTSHLSTNPIDLWFETEPERQKLWLPGKFRLIGTMNDVDTSFVNSISQGLTRRFHFVYVGVPDRTQLPDEMDMCRRQAQTWLKKDFPHLVPASENVKHRPSLNEIAERIQNIFSWLRYGNTTAGSAQGDSHHSWPIGSAQAVDLWKAVLLTLASRADVSKEDLVRALDFCFADRIVPQMGTLRNSHLREIQEWFRTEQSEMHETERAVRHLMNTQSVR